MIEQMNEAQFPEHWQIHLTLLKTEDIYPAFQGKDLKAKLPVLSGYNFKSKWI